MNFADFKATWNKFDGWNRCQMIQFDNDMRWVLNERNYHSVYEDIKDDNGNVITKRLIPNDPRGFFKVDETGNYILDENGQMVPDYKDLHDYIIFEEDIESICRKIYFTGTPPEDMPYSPLYTIEVRNVENIQLLCFCDENNLEARGLYPIHG
jgi:hypothetical protein